MTLQEKESYFNKAIFDRFILENGTFAASLEHGKNSIFSDQCYFGSLMAAAYCFKYKWLKKNDEDNFQELDVCDTKENPRRLFEGWDQPFKEMSPLAWFFQYWLAKYFNFI
tara:strand:+ start:1186 stop:1518 length:333 start_codon:yes stop_codon:yes gene_type:complete